MIHNAIHYVIEKPADDNALPERVWRPSLPKVLLPYAKALQKFRRRISRARRYVWGRVLDRLGYCELNVQIHEVERVDYHVLIKPLGPIQGDTWYALDHQNTRLVDCATGQSIPCAIARKGKFPTHTLTFANSGRRENPDWHS